MTVRLCKSGASAEASNEAVQFAVVQFAVVQFEVAPPIVGERSFEEEQLQLVAVVITPGDIVIRTINIVVEAAPMLAVFIVVVQSQEVALLSEAEPLGARVSLTAVSDAAGNK